MNEDRRLQALREENPFISSSVGDPRDYCYQDVSSVNEQAFNGLSDLIRKKAKALVLPCAGLVRGETGSGKTHLIVRIANFCKISDTPFALAYIQPIEDPNATYSYLLREIMVNLTYPPDRYSTQSPLELMIGKICKNLSYKGSKEERIADEIRSGLVSALTKDKPNMIRNLFRLAKTSVKILIERNEPETSPAEILRSRFPDIPKSFLQVLLQYQLPEKRAAVTDWLRGGILDENDAVLLQVPDRMQYSPEMREQEARDILSYIGILMAACNQPLVVCFDRLENYDTEDKVRSLGKMIEFLTDHAKAMLSLVFARGQQWEETFKYKLNQQIISRLETNSFHLRGCGNGQASEIVRSRLAAVLSREDAEALFPFGKNIVSAMFRGSMYSPRQVITLANQKLRQFLYPDTPPVGLILMPDKLKNEFQNLCKMIQSNTDRYPPDRNRLAVALKLYLSHFPSENGIAIEEILQPDDRYIDLQCRIICEKKEPVMMAFIIDNETNHAAVRAALRRGIDFLEQKAESQVVYIREARCPIPPPPQWKNTNEILADFRRSGGHVLFPDKETICRWYALYMLSHAVRAGEVMTDEGLSVSEQELALFIREDIYRKNDPGFQGIASIIKR